MNIVLLDGASGTGPNADAIAPVVAETLALQSTELRHFFLGLTDVGHCQGHFDCWVRSPGRCRLADEGQEIERAVVLADQVVMLTPVRFGGMGSELKKAVDRLIPLVLPFFRLHADMTHHKLRYDHMPNFVTVGIADKQTTPEQQALFRAMAESIALNIGAPRWSVGVLTADQEIAPILRNALTHGAPPGNPSGSFKAAKTDLKEVLRAESGPGPWPQNPKVAILTGSAKGEGKSNSTAIGRYLEKRFAAQGAEVDVISATDFARGPKVAEPALRTLLAADVLAVAAPLYVDGLPFLVTRALECVADRRKARGCPPARLFGLINCGFPEPEHTRFAFRVLRQFAGETGYTFAGGIALGEAEVIQGQPLEARGGMTKALREALDEVVAATIAGTVVTAETIERTLVPMMPPGPFRALASAGWYMRAWANDGPVLGLRAKPFETISQEDWEQMALSGWARARPLRLIGRRQETDAAVTLIFEDPAHDPIRYSAGQYITLEAEIGGQTVRRAYSLSSIPRDAQLSITVKRVAGGAMSNFLHDTLRVGDLLRSYGPAGDFTAGPADCLGSGRKLCLVAGGAGIVPLQAIARAVLLDELDSEVTLIYGSSSPEATIFADALDALARSYPNRFRLHIVFESSGLGPGARLDADGLSPILARMDLAQLDRILLCGPDDMRLAVRGVLTSAGVEDGRIEEEVFTTPRPTMMPQDAQTAILTRPDGSETTLLVHPGATLLDACVDAGEPVRFSCMSGTCGTCRVRILSGGENVTLDQPLAELDDGGEFPACVARLFGPITFALAE